jgi:hypothetical protein
MDTEGWQKRRNWPGGCRRVRCGLEVQIPAANFATGYFQGRSLEHCAMVIRDGGQEYWLLRWEQAMQVRCARGGDVNMRAFGFMPGGRSLSLSVQGPTEFGARQSSAMQDPNLASSSCRPAAEHTLHLDGLQFQRRRHCLFPIQDRRRRRLLLLSIAPLQFPPQASPLTRKRARRRLFEAVS